MLQAGRGAADELAEHFAIAQPAAGQQALGAGPIVLARYFRGLAPVLVQHEDLAGQGVVDAAVCFAWLGFYADAVGAYHVHHQGVENAQGEVVVLLKVASHLAQGATGLQHFIIGAAGGAAVFA